MSGNPRIDLTGNPYHEGDVEGKDPDRPGYGICKCSCGTIRSVSGKNLKSKKSKSCGCKRKKSSKGPTKREIGNRYEECIVKKYGGRNKRAVILGLCLCDCGNEFVAAGTDLRSHRIKSCGHCSQNGTRVSYDGWNDEISFIDETKRNPDNLGQLQVRCKRCGKWVNPTVLQVYHRIGSLNNKNMGENHIYCSQECKDKCPIFGKQLGAEGKNPKHNNRDPKAQKEGADMVKAKANHECEICGSKDDLTGHHIEPINCNEIESWDVDNGVCLCKKCHIKHGHTDIGCRFVDLQKRNIKRR